MTQERGLRDEVARGVAWSMAEKIGSMLLTTVVRLVILRLLTREIFGYLAIPAAAVTILAVVVDGGFSQTLIRRREHPSQGDCNAVFLFNMLVSTVLYGALVAAAPFVARYYGMPEIARIAPVFFLLLPLGALGAVQNAILTRRFRFAHLSKVTFLSSLAGGLAAIVLAWCGLGIWSLVAERILSQGLRSALLWRVGAWRPTWRCSLRPLRGMASFGFGLMTTELIANFYNKIPQLFLGARYSAPTLGSFDQAVKLKDMPATTGMQAVQAVTFPALSRIGDDAPKLAESYRQVVMVVAFVMFPVMLGLSAAAHDLFAALLRAEWMPTVPYFEVVCLAGLFSPIAMIAYNVLKARAGGGLIVRIEVIKKLLMTVVFAVTIPRSVMAVVWGLVVIALAEMVVNVAASLRFTELGLGRLLRTLLPVAAAAAVMYALVRVVAVACPGGAAVRLVAEVTAGAAGYLLFALVFRLEALRVVVGLAKKQIARK